jgi:signal transduction histidine kinase
VPRDSLEEARDWLQRVGHALLALGPPLARAGRSARDRLRALLTPLAATALRRGTGLSAKLLLLTILFVMLAEVLIFVPSIANFRINWLSDRLVAAKLAALAADAVPDGIVPEPLRLELLLTAQVRSVAWKRGNERRLVLPPEAPLQVDASYDFRASAHAAGPFNEFALRLRLIWEALAVFFDKKTQVILVLGEPGMRGGDFIEIVLPEAPLKAAMIRYGLNVFGLSVIISIITAALVYFALNSLLVKPMMRITHNMLAFSRNPEDASRIIEPTERTDEIGTAERELANMQLELTQMLQQKNRLAALGLAVSKINHDLRNMLASAQLISDRLAHLPDPAVQRFAPKLIASLDRAIDLCNTTLRFGRAEEAPPRRELIELRGLVEEVGDGLGLPRDGVIEWEIAIARALRVDADRDQLFRVLSNLCRNAVQAIEQQEGANAQGRICVAAARRGNRVEIDVTDNGPGVPPKARAHLFQAFQGAARKGGTGLGLAVALELITAHGGTIHLRDTQTGATFIIEIPDRGA